MELRPLRTPDLEPLAAWLPRVAAGAGCARWASEGATRTATARRDALVGVEGDVQAFLSYTAKTPRRDAARIEFLAVPPERRRLGIAGRAVLALEQRLAPPVQRVYVLVPSRLGLAFYFWLRLGYRTLTQREWPAPPEDRPSVWMVRELS